MPKALNHVAEQEYELDKSVESVWVTVNNLSVYIKRTDEGVVVDIFPLNREDGESLASTYAFDSEGKEG